jgi:hypothetical protein
MSRPPSSCSSEVILPTGESDCELVVDEGICRLVAARDDEVKEDEERER